MRVLVTGGSSRIGIGVARSLAARGDVARCFQRRPVDDLRGEAGVEQVLGDVTDEAGLVDAASGCQAIVHLAAKVGVVGTRTEFERVNVDGTRHVIAAARHHGIDRVVHVSSPSVAHHGAPLVGAGADAPTFGRRHAWYPETKARAEAFALAAAADDLGVVAVRPHLVWGPGDTQLVGRIVERARAGRLALVGGGTALVDATYVDNAVDGLVAALDAVGPGASCSGRAYVIANGEPRPIRELVLGICAAAGVEARPRSVSLPAALAAGGLLDRVWPRLRPDDEPPLTRFLAEQLGTAHWFDPRPARDDLGWVPRITVDDGLARLGAWFTDRSGG